MGTNNQKLWRDFLQPLKGLKGPKKQPYKYENFDAYVSLSTDLAYQLNPQVLVVEDVATNIVDSDVVDSDGEEGEQKSVSDEKKRVLLEGGVTDPADTVEECNQGVEDQVEEIKQLEANARLHSQDTEGSQSEEEVSSLKDDLQYKTRDEIVLTVEGDDEDTKYPQPEECQPITVTDIGNARSGRIPLNNGSEDMNVRGYKEEVEDDEESIHQPSQSFSEEKLLSTVQTETEIDEKSKDLQIAKEKVKPDLANIKDSEEEDDDDEAIQKSDQSFGYIRTLSPEGITKYDCLESQNTDGTKLGILEMEEQNKLDKTVELSTKTKVKSREDSLRQKYLEDSGVIEDMEDMETEEFSHGEEEGRGKEEPKDRNEDQEASAVLSGEHLNTKECSEQEDMKTNKQFTSGKIGTQIQVPTEHSLDGNGIKSCVNGTTDVKKHNEELLQGDAEGDIEEYEGCMRESQSPTARLAASVENSPKETEYEKHDGFNRKAEADKGNFGLNMGSTKLFDNVLEISGYEANINTSQEQSTNKTTYHEYLTEDILCEKTRQDEVDKKSRKRKSEDVTLVDMKRKLSKEESFSSKARNENIPQAYQKVVPVLSKHLSSLPEARGQKVIPKEEKQRALNRPQRKVNDKSKHVSQWTLKMFSEYVDFRKYVKELKLSSSDVDERLTNEIYHHYENALRVNNITLQDAPKHPLKESYARILFDGLLLRLCCKHNITLETEVAFQLSSLPSGQFDYLMLTKSSKPFGCIETKSPCSLDAKSFVQAVLQLCSLQQIASKREIDIESTPVFCILTDSFRFVFIQLQGAELRVEQEPKSRRSYVPRNQTPENNVLKLRCLDAKNDFTNIIAQISHVIEMSLQLIQ